MNYLAHLYLSQDNGLSKAGNLMADFLKQADLSIQPDSILNGIANHRATDKFTDHYPAIKSLRTEFDPAFRRFVPIMLDVSFDHMLAKSWQDYHELALTEFTQRAHQQLVAAEQYMPDLMKNRLRGMAEHGWLASYTSKQTIDKTLISISQRIRFENNLDQAYSEVLNQYELIEVTFRAFFPVLVKHIKALKIE
ncbi:MAG: ACP phosphodiesterase [Leucothrix sp.]